MVTSYLKFRNICAIKIKGEKIEFVRLIGWLYVMCL